LLCDKISHLKCVSFWRKMVVVCTVTAKSPSESHFSQVFTLLLTFCYVSPRTILILPNCITERILCAYIHHVVDDCAVLYFSVFDCGAVLYFSVFDCGAVLYFSVFVLLFFSSSFFPPSSVLKMCVTYFLPCMCYGFVHLKKKKRLRNAALSKGKVKKEETD